MYMLRQKIIFMLKTKDKEIEANEKKLVELHLKLAFLKGELNILKNNNDRGHVKRKNYAKHKR